MTQPVVKHRAREYETIFILHPDSRTDVVDTVAARCLDVLERLDGKLLKAENWGRRRLAYPVQKNAKGIYIYLHYLGYSDLVHELERNLRVIDAVIKYMTVKVDEGVDPSVRPVGEGDISFVAKFDDSLETADDADADADADAAETEAEAAPDAAETEAEAAPEAEAKAEAAPEAEAKAEAAPATDAKPETDNASDADGGDNE